MANPPRNTPWSLGVLIIASVCMMAVFSLATMLAIGFEEWPAAMDGANCTLLSLALLAFARTAQEVLRHVHAIRIGE